MELAQRGVDHRMARHLTMSARVAVALVVLLQFGNYQDSHQGSFHHRALPPGLLPGLPPGLARWVKIPVLLRLRGAEKEKEGKRKGEGRGGKAPFKSTKRLLLPRRAAACRRHRWAGGPRAAGRAIPSSPPP